MDVDEIQTQGHKFPRIGNGRGDCNKIGQKGEEQYPDDEEDGEIKRSGGGRSGGGIEIGGGGVGRLCGWPSSRIVRVSRASGGKDRHSKVWTSKGLRDRRVRLSVTTAIQFYDLQDRLGYDQPSKAVEWLLKAAAKSIDELPSINTSFPDTPQQLSDEKRSSAGTEQGFDSADLELDGGDQTFHHQQHQQHVSLSKSACSSTSETSKGSGLSLSQRSESRIKARERARERKAGKEKEKESHESVNHHQNVNPISQSSFTELLTGGINNVNSATTTASPNGSAANLFQKSTRPQWSSAPMDYFTSGLLNSSPSRNPHSSGFSGQIHLGNSLPPSMAISQFSLTADHHHHHHHHHHPELQHFSFVPDHLIPVSTAGGGGDYNLNFTISSGGLAGFNRGTLQSNSPSLLPHVQRLSTIDGSNVPFFIRTAASNAAPVENHHQFPAGLDGRLQLCYGDGGGGGGVGRLCGWPSSRIVRVSGASGGKDRHSKVWTSKGLRDRRVRLSVTTAIQFYNLQDRLGYDQPSKAVEWLLKAAAKSIDELPSINTSFPDKPQQLSDEKRSSAGTEQGFDSADLELGGGDQTFHHQQHQQQQQQYVSLSRARERSLLACLVISWVLFCWWIISGAVR